MTFLRLSMNFHLYKNAFNIFIYYLGVLSDTNANKKNDIDPLLQLVLNNSECKYRRPFKWSISYASVHETSIFNKESQEPVSELLNQFCLK